MESNEMLNAMKQLVNESPFYRYMDMKVVSGGDGVSRLEMNTGQDHQNLYGILHGGAVATILDSACGIAIGTLLKAGEVVVTVDMRINFVSNIKGGTLVGEGNVLHRGRQTGVVEAKVTDEDGNLVAVGMSTHIICSPEDLRVSGAAEGGGEPG